METQAISGQQSTAATNPSATSSLGGDDFLELLIAQLVNQDPLEPTSNQELLNQISSIRDIELSTNLSDSLQSLTDQQRFASAGALIGHQIGGTTEDGAEVSGVVNAVRFDASGKATLELADGTRIALEAVESITEPTAGAEGLVGRFVTGVDQTDPENPVVIEGIVSSVSTDESGQFVLELDTGQKLPLTEVIDVRSADGTDVVTDVLDFVTSLF